AYGRGVTALVHLSGGDPLSRLVTRSFSFVPGDAHYDGVYFYAIARDPLARGIAHKLIDSSAYRYGHPGYGWLAWLASAGGRPGAIPYALVLVPVGLLVWEGARFAAGRRPTRLAARAGALTIGPALYGAWIGYCSWVFGRLPVSDSHLLAWPLAGWVDTFHRAAVQTQFGD